MELNGGAHEGITAASSASSPAMVVGSTGTEMDDKVYEAAAQGDIQFLETLSESEIGRLRSPAKNTILHLFIIAQSTRKDREVEKVLNFFRRFRPPPDEDLKDATVVSMLDMCPSFLWDVNEAGDTPLHMAARHGHADIAKVLIERAKSSHQDVETASQQVAAQSMLHAVNAGGETALHQAVRYQHCEVVKVIIGEDNAEFCYLANADGETPLYMAAERGNDELVKMILETYASPAYQGPDGRTAFHAAVLHSSSTKTHQRSMYMYTSSLTLSITQSLVTYTLDSMRILHSDLQIMISNLRGTHLPEAAEAILNKRGLELLSREIDGPGRTPLHYKPSLLNYDKSAAFIVDNDGNTALHIVASKGDSSSVGKFIEECPQCFEVVDRQGRNALHLALESADEHTVDLILKSRYLCDLLKMKDNNGDTPLHLLAASPNHRVSPTYMGRVTEDPRFDKMAFNKHNLNPLDVILTSNYTHSNDKSILKLCMIKAGICPGQREIIGSGTPMGKENTGDGQINRNKEGDDDDLKEAGQNHLVVAALIATVTFAAGFTMPGGYIQEQGPELGYVILSKSAAFKAFVITDALAMVFSSGAVFIHLLITMDKGKKQVSELFKMALPLTLVAIVAMVIAFITGTHAVLAHSPLLAITASAVGCLFFFLFVVLAIKVFFSSIFLFIMVFKELRDQTHSAQTPLILN